MGLAIGISLVLLHAKHMDFDTQFLEEKLIIIFC